ncbi:MAG: ATP-binding cassette domain-containing protein, partial [Acidilobaceae archaeon]
GKPLKRGEAIYVPQDNELLPWLNVVDNVALPLIVAGHSKARAREIALRTLREVGLERLAWRYPKTLSGGERKKVAVTRVLISGSPVLLLDEPTANIDPTARKDFWNLLKKVATEKLVIASSHDVFEALKEANEAFVLSGRPAKVVAKLRGGIESCEVFSELTKLYYGS